MAPWIDRIRRMRPASASLPIALLGICLLAYGLFIPWLGFYWDDWPMVWFNHAFGPLAFPRVWQAVRPVLGWFFIPSMAAFGDNPQAWQVFGLAMRWLSAVSLWWAARQVWPRHGRQAAWLALLFVVYPGFQQQAVAVVYSHYFWILALHWFSIGAMVRAVRRPEARWRWTAAALLSGAVSIFALEYFVVLEVLRPFLLWQSLGDTHVSPRRRVAAVARTWLPFLAVFVAFVVWRATSPSITLYEASLLQDLGLYPATTVMRTAGTVAQDIFEAAVLAWGQAFVLPKPAEFGLRSTLVYAALVLAVIALVAAYLVESRSGGLDKAEGSSTWWRGACALGLLALLAGGWPFWLAELPLALHFPFDRFTLSMMFGACLLLLGVLEGLVRRPALRALVLSVLVGFSVGKHFQEGNAFRRGWEAQQRFFWNLAWRVPGLEPGTAILANELPLPYMTDNSLIAPLNWMYAPDYTGGDMPYVVLDIDTRLGRSLPALEENRPIVQRYRLTTFRGTTSQALVVNFVQPGCLRVLDQYLDDSSRAVAPQTEAAIHLSRLGLIESDRDPPATLPEHLRGEEPTQGWCYYFERADLARQRGDWPAVASLGDQAFARSDQPNQAEERIPFIEGYAHVGNWERALQLTEEALAHNASIGRILCHAWERIETSTTPGAAREAALRQARALVCMDPVPAHPAAAGAAAR